MIVYYPLKFFDYILENYSSPQITKFWDKVDVPTTNHLNNFGVDFAQYEVVENFPM